MSGLNQAASLIPRHDVTIPRILVLVTDGQPDCGAETTGDVVAAAKAIRDSGIFVLPVGVGSNVDNALLQQVRASDFNQIKSDLGYITAVRPLADPTPTQGPVPQRLRILSQWCSERSAALP